MNSAREYLKELIERGESLQKPKYDINTINSASQLASYSPSERVIQTWKRDVSVFNNQYLKKHAAYTLINSALNGIYDLFRMDSLIYYLEEVYNDFAFWDSIDANQSNIFQHQSQAKNVIYDVFISHANADKASYVDDLKESLDKLNIRIFYDKDTLEWGDNWKNKILEGVEKAEFAIIVISENFFGREWTEKELTDFLSRQNRNGQKIILPILHNVTVAQLQEKYPAVADIQALDSSNYTCDQIALKFAAQLIKRLKAQQIMTKQQFFSYCLSAHGTSPDYPFEGDFETAVFRHSGSRKWYAIIMRVSRRKFGFDSDEVIDVVNLKLPTEMFGSFGASDGVYPAYHMNKLHWISVLLPDAPNDVVQFLVNVSFEATKSKTKLNKHKADS